MMNGNMYIEDDHKIHQPGVDYGQSNPTVIAISFGNKTIAIHQSGCTTWVGRGTTGYAEAYTTFGTFEDIKFLENKIILKGFKNLLETKSTKAKGIENVKQILARERKNAKHDKED